MRAVFALAVVAISLVAAQDGASVDPIAAAVQSQWAMSSRYLDIILRFQRAQSQSIAASLYLQESLAKTKHEEVHPATYGVWLEEDYEESAELEEVENLEEEEHHTTSPEAFRLMASYHLFHSNQIRLYQIIINAPLVQSEYYMNRFMQSYLVAMAGGQVPPQITQYLYLSSISTHMKTLKLATSLQVVSHVRTWLEDEIDVGTAVVGKLQHFKEVAAEQIDDLLLDQHFACNSNLQFAMLDFQIFFLDYYTNSIMTSLFAAPPQAAADNNNNNSTSFLEEGAAVEGQTGMFPALMMAGGMGGGGFQYYTMYLKYYQLIAQYLSSQACVSHTTVEQHIRTHVEDSSKFSASSQQSYTMWASYLLQASQIGYMLSIFDMYSLYGGAAQPQAAAAAAK